MARFFANAAGFFCALFVLTFGAAFLRIEQEVVMASAWSLGIHLAVVGVMPLLVFTLVRFSALMWALRVLRGEGAVRFSSPSECRSIGVWFAYDWRFFGRGGWQHGERLLGFEVAYTGTLR